MTNRLGIAVLNPGERHPREYRHWDRVCAGCRYNRGNDPGLTCPRFSAVLGSEEGGYKARDATGAVVMLRAYSCGSWRGPQLVAQSTGNRALAL